MANKDRVLVVDDEKGIRNLLGAMLERKGYKAIGVESAEKALEVLECQDFDLVITDLRLPGLSGEELVAKLKKKRPSIPVVVISAYGNTKNVVDVIKLGAEDYLSKPFTQEDLEVVVLKSLEKHRLLLENERLRSELSGKSSNLIGASRSMTHIMDRINKFSKSDSHVLITGESGVGKGLVAREVHEISGRSRGPFVQVNAGAIPATLFEAELFGVKKGAYTGAGESRDGLFQAADGGTLFLDEIAEVPPEAQAKLLRVLDSGEVRSVGDTRTKKINVRIIAATNQNLDEMVENKSFRKDLFYRLSNLVLDVPPLRERTEDIPLLADYFLKQTQKRGETSRRLSTGALKWLMRQKWLGNVRELKNVLERAVLLSDQDVIKAEDLTEQTVEETPGRMGVFRQAKRRQVEIFEKNYVRDLLKECSGNVSKAAMKAGLARRNFQLMIKKYNMKAAQYRKNL